MVSVRHFWTLSQDIKWWHLHNASSNIVRITDLYIVIDIDSLTAGMDIKMTSQTKCTGPADDSGNLSTNPGPSSNLSTSNARSLTARMTGVGYQSFSYVTL